MNKLKVAFCGTPEFCLPTLELLHNHPLVSLICIISQPSRPAGRGHKITPPPVIDFAINKNISHFQTENINKDDSIINFLESSQVDLMIVLAFAQFLSQRILDLPQYGCFNIHTSLLPKYRGAAPIQWALLNGDKKTGVTIQKMVKKMDAGDIAHSQEVLIPPSEGYNHLATRLKLQAAISVGHFFELFSNQKINLQKQDEGLISFAPPIKKEDGWIDFNNYSAQEILNRLKAFELWPGIYCFLNDKRLKIVSAIQSELKLNPGQVSSHQGQLIIGCKVGSLRLQDVQIEGKKICKDEELLRGLRGPLELGPIQGKK